MKRRSFLSLATVAPFVPATEQSSWGPPIMLSARGEHQRVVLSFTPVAGAASYDVHCTSTPGGTRILEGVLVTDYTVHGLENGTAYRFQVAAVGPQGKTPLSAAVTATPVAEMSWDELSLAFAGNNPTRSSCPFWMIHGRESDDELLGFLEVAYRFGFEGVTLHPYDMHDFLGEGHWHRWQVIVEHARKLGLGVWQQDDRDYPSGWAGGTIGAKEPALARWEITLPHSRIVHSPASVSIDLSSVLSPHQIPVAVSAFGPKGRVEDLSDSISSGHLDWHVPEGQWEIFVAAAWQPGIWDPRSPVDHVMGQDRRYIDPLSERATDLYVQAIQGATYSRLGSEFGRIWKGFFLDEVGFNSSGSKLGTAGVGYPYTPDLFPRFEKRFGYSLRPWVPLLWSGRGTKTTQVRYDYMEFVSSEYRRLFLDKQRRFAEAHGIQIIGHVIGSLDFEYALGRGTGGALGTLEHFSMGGFDHVFDQWYAPEEDNYWRRSKNASSVSHYNQVPLDEAMVEHFAATGWRTGLTEMKAMVDWTTCRGLNRIVPCGLDTLDPPVWQDQPEFWLHGRNPLAPYFHEYQVIVNRETMMIRGGRHAARALVLDPAESAWSGKHDDLWKVDKALSQAHFDYDNIPYRVFTNASRCRIAGDRILLGREDYAVVVLPAVDAIPLAVLEKLDKFCGTGGTVILLGAGLRFEPKSVGPGFNPQKRQILPGLPVLSVDGRNDAEVAALSEKLWSGAFAGNGRALYVSFKDLTSVLYSLNLHDVWIEPNLSGLQYYHRELSGRDLYFFNNEGEAVHTEVRLRSARGVPELWDPVTGRIVQAPVYSEQDGWLRFRLDLDRYESIFIVVNPSAKPWVHLISTDADEVRRLRGGGVELRKNQPGLVRYKMAGEEKQWATPKAALTELRLREGWTRIPGNGNRTSYTVRFDWQRGTDVGAELRIDKMTQRITAYLNGQEIDARFTYPFRFDLSAVLRPKQNELELLHVERYTFESKLGDVRVVPYYRFSVRSL